MVEAGYPGISMVTTVTRLIRASLAMGRRRGGPAYENSGPAMSQHVSGLELAFSQKHRDSAVAGPASLRADGIAADCDWDRRSRRRGACDVRTDSGRGQYRDPPPDRCFHRRDIIGLRE